MPVQKSLLIAFLTAIIIGGLTSVGYVHFVTVQASTDVSGIIASDTTWTKANSPTFVPFLTAPNPEASPIPSSSPSSTPSPSPNNQTITRIQSYQYGAGMGVGNEPSVQTSITLTNAPLQGDVLISVIGIQGMYTTVTDIQGVVTTPPSFETATVSSINETGVIWTRQVKGNSTAYNVDVEIWLGVVVSQASPSITVNLDSLSSNTIWH